MDLKRALLQAWNAYAEKACIVDNDQRFSFDQIVRRIVGVSQLIGGSDPSKSGHVAIILPNSELFVTCFMGCLAADRAAVPINCLLSPPEVRFIIEHSESSLVLTVSHFRPLLEQVQKECESEIVPFYIDEMLANVGAEQIAAMLEQVDPNRLDSGESDPDRTACLIYTSGTTGVAKGVVLTHKNILSNFESVQRLLDIHTTDVFLTVLPLFHVFGMTTAMILPLLSGASMVMMPRFHPGKAVELIEREKVTALLMVPSMFALIMRETAKNPERISSVRLAFSGGGPLSPALGEELRKSLGIPLYMGYGLTETSPVVSVNLAGEKTPNSVGKPIPGVEVEIRDDERNTLPPGENGAIWARGANIMREYYRNPEATSEALEDTGWLNTGDIGYLDEEGFLYITGRRKEMIIFGGEKIFPQEVEHALVAHPSVAEAAVVGVSDTLRGEIPKAFVVLNEGASFDERALRNHCADRLATFKVPREFAVVETLPKNALGKVQKHKLAEGA